MKCRLGGLANAQVGCARWVLGSVMLLSALSARPMDLLQAYQAAQSNDATILAARAGAQAGRERLPQARSQLMPNIAASLARNNNNLNSTTPNILGNEQTIGNTYPSTTQTVTLRQPLIRNAQVAQYRQALAQVDDSNAALLQDEQNLAVRVSGAYFEAVLTHEQLEMVLAQRKAYTTQLDAARKALIAGSGTRTDVDEAQARLDMTAAAEIEARQNIDYTLRQLQAMVNQPIDKLAALDVSRFELQLPQPGRVEEWADMAEQGSPQLQALRAQVEVAHQEVEKAKSGHFPTLDAVAQWSRSESENVTNVQSRYTNASIGLQLNIPIYSGGYANSAIRQALAGLERAQQVLEAGRREMALRVHKEFKSAIESIPKIQALEQSLRSADQWVLSTQKSLQAGNRTVLDVLNAQQQRTVVLRDLAQARYVFLMSKIRLLSLVGRADEAAVGQMSQMLKH